MNGMDPASRLHQAICDAVPDEAIAEGIRDLLGATTITRAGARIPDWNARERGIRLVLDYKLGKPVQRVAVTHSNLPETEEDAMNTLLSSPAALEAFIRTIAEQPGGRSMLHEMCMSPRDRQLAEAKNVPNPP